MLVVALGDSLTAGDYGVYGKSCIANVKKEGYPYFLSRLLGFEVKNFGFCGANAVSYLKKCEDGEVDVRDADLVLLMLGTNGGLSGETDTEGNRAYIKIIDFVRENAPKAKIVLLTPPRATENKEKSNFGYAENVAGAVSFVRKTAKETGFPLIDINASGIFTEENEDVMMPNDGLHLGETGYRLLAEEIYANLKRGII